jgi:7-cyano-7-deazaguanine reductase
VELKSLKLYLNTYRDQYVSHEEAVNKIFSDLTGILSPRNIKVEGDFHPRGNVHTVIKVEGGSGLLLDLSNHKGFIYSHGSQ